MLYIYVIIFVLGLVNGSFLTVVGERLPKNISIVKPASHCPNCLKKIKWYDLIPIISYLVLKGKCRYCHKKIPKLYPVMEILCGLLYLISFIIFGFSFKFYSLILISSLLIIIFVSDLKYNIILDSPLVISSIIFIILEFIYFDYKEVLISICYGVSIFTILYLIKLLGDYLFKRESLGGGDIKLGFVMGLFLSPKVSLVCLIIGSLIALIYVFIKKLPKEKELAYGPFLMIAFYICFIFKDSILYFLNYVL